MFKGKSRIFSIVFLAVFVVSALLVVPSCQKKEDVIKIGVIGPLTGEGATYGMAMKRGVDLAAKEVNERDGILGRKLQIVYEDSKLEPKEGINALRKLIQTQDVQVVIGAAASRVTLAMAPIAEKEQVILFSSISTTDELKNAGDFIFRNVPPNSEQGRTAADFVIKGLKKNKIAVFYKNDEYGENLKAGFNDVATEIGGRVIVEDKYNPGQRAFKNSLMKIKKTNPEVIYFPGNYQESGIILKQAKELDVNGIFIGGDGSYSPELINIAGKAANGSYYTLMALPQNSDEMTIFTKSFEKMYGHKPGVYDAYSYDALMTIVEAIKVSGYNSKKIKEALYSITYKGVTGITNFDQYGEVDKPYAIYEVINGEFERVDWNP